MLWATWVQWQQFTGEKHQSEIGLIQYRFDVLALFHAMALCVTYKNQQRALREKSCLSGLRAGDLLVSGYKLEFLLRYFLVFIKGSWTLPCHGSCTFGWVFSPRHIITAFEIQPGLSPKRSRVLKVYRLCSLCAGLWDWFSGLRSFLPGHYS